MPTKQLAANQSPIDSVLAIDIGNSNIVLAMIQNSIIKKKWRLASNAKALSDIESLLIEFKSLFATTAAIICSVVPSLNSKVINFLTDLHLADIITLEAAKLDLMPMLIDNKLQLGCDRLVNAYAAYHQYQQPLLLIDFGTATTFDVVDKQGNYCGGIICCGINTSLKALVNNTELLPDFELADPDTLIGKNTISCMQSGLIYGAAAMCDGLSDMIAEKLGYNPLIITTGGLAGLMHNYTKKEQIVDQDLTIWGLDLIWQKYFRPH